MECVALSKGFHVTDRRTVDGRGNGLFALAVVIFVVLVLVFKAHFAFWINTDATAYVSIARQYLAGGFARAVNGYWGPLLSWLLAPLLATGMEPLAAARWIEVAAGLGTLFAVRWLALRLGASRRSMGVLALCLCVPLADYSMLLVTPDILLVFLLVMYCGFVLPDAYRERRLYGIGAGLCGGLAYLAKSYALPFFLVHFVLINLMHLNRAGVAPAGAASRRREVLLNFAAGLAAFVLVAGPWVGVLTHKYGQLTCGTAGQRAHCLVGPEYYGDDPVFGTLIDPPSFDATSYWDDPAIVKLVAWRPWESEDLFYHQLWLICVNLWTMIRQVTGLIPFAAAAFLYFLGAAMGGHKSSNGPRSGGTGRDSETREGAEPVAAVTPDLYAYPLLSKVAVPLLLTVSVFAGGFLPIYVELRYLWFVVVLLTVMTVLVLQQFAISHKFRSAVWSFLATWLVLTCAIPPLNELLAQPDRGREPFELAVKLADTYHVHGNLASNDNWAPSLFTAFHMRARYFGQVPKEERASEEALVAALKKHGIDYYLVWGAEERLAPGPLAVKRFPEVTGGAIKGLRVYAMAKPES